VIEDFEYSERPAEGFQYTATVDAADGSGNYLITDHLAMMYDLIMNSMDMGSGFLDAEDHQRLGEIGQLCGFEMPECNQHAPETIGVCQAGKVGHDGPHWMVAYFRGEHERKRVEW